MKPLLLLTSKSSIFWEKNLTSVIKLERWLLDASHQRCLTTNLKSIKSSLVLWSQRSASWAEIGIFKWNYLKDDFSWSKWIYLRGMTVRVFQARNLFSYHTTSVALHSFDTVFIVVQFSVFLSSFEIFLL